MAPFLQMADIEKLLQHMKAAPASVRFNDLRLVCERLPDAVAR